jgi:hypothetical protein
MIEPGVKLLLLRHLPALINRIVLPATTNWEYHSVLATQMPAFPGGRTRETAMQSLRVPVATLAAVLSFPIAACVAQSATAPTDAQATAATSAQSNAITSRYMTSVDTELTSRLDSRNAAVGQEITARTKQTAKLADGTTLPKGTRLVGHVTGVQTQSKDQPYAALAMTFDRAELKGGQSVALRSVIRTVAPPPTVSPSASDSMMPDETAGPIGPGTSAGGMGSTGTRGGVGLGGVGGVGGVARGAGQTAGGVGQTAGGIGQTTGSTVGGVTRDTRSLPEATAGTAGGVVNQAGETVSSAPHATGLPGVVLSTSTAGDVSGTLMASGKNISLETGTQITLGVITR